MSTPRILIAEDELHIAKLVEFKLQKEGFNVDWAEDGEIALEKLTSTLNGADQYHLLILDVMMPKRDGWEVLKHLRAKEEFGDLPVVMLTAKGQQRDLMNAAQLGATQFVRKPFDPEELCSIVKGILE